MYLTHHTKYAAQNSKVTIVTDSHWPVIIVEDEVGNRWPVRVELLSDEPVEVETEQPKEIKKRESTKALTQAEKLQL